MHLRLRLADLAIRWRFKRHAERPLDVRWVRERIGRPMWMRRIVTPPVVRATMTAGRVPLELLTPPETTHGGSLERVLLYVHGGGYIACSPATHRPLAARLAREWRALAVVPDYALAPEQPFPAGRDDVVATWRWMLDELQVDPAQAVWAGDSAGGGLALAAALASADVGLPMPSAIVGFSPWTDLACTGQSLQDNAARCAMFVPAQLEQAARLYAGSRAISDPMLSPLQADLSALPPLCLHASTSELLRDDALRFADRARAAGATVECRLWPEMPHVWQFLAGLLPEARESLDAAGVFVRHYVRADLARTAVVRTRAVEASHGRRNARAAGVTIP
jgi:monoterpene epsilon-lactone hydrolase